MSATFRSFLKLPVEIQLMIWEYYSPPTRHVFALKNGRHREYGAVDIEKGVYVDRSWVRKGKDHIANFIPFLSKIQLPGELSLRLISTKGLPHSRYDIRDDYDIHYKPKVRKPVICVDFSRDTFYFDQSFYLYHSRNGEDEWFRFLCSPLNRLRPPMLAEDHWIFKVRYLALVIRRESMRGSEWDHMILRGMKQLKVVWLDSHDPQAGPWYIAAGLKPFLMVDEMSNVQRRYFGGLGKEVKKFLTRKLKEYNIGARLHLSVSRLYTLK